MTVLSKTTVRENTRNEPSLEELKFWMQTGFYFSNPFELFFNPQFYFNKQTFRKSRFWNSHTYGHLADFWKEKFDIMAINKINKSVFLQVFAGFAPRNLFYSRTLERSWKVFLIENLKLYFGVLIALVFAISVFSHASGHYVVTATGHHWIESKITIIVACSRFWLRSFGFSILLKLVRSWCFLSQRF